jgi:hypothetical protein
MYNHLNQSQPLFCAKDHVLKFQKDQLTSTKVASWEISKPTQKVSRSVIQLEDILDSADDSIPSSSESGSVYVPDDSSSDSIPSSPEPTKLRLDEVTGLFILAVV